MSASLIYYKSTRRLVSGDTNTLISLRPKEQILWDILYENSPGIVTRKELCEIVWQGRYVSDFTINQTINALRKKLSDCERTLIVTMPKQGYALDRSLVTDNRESGEQAACHALDTSFSDREKVTGEEVPDTKAVAVAPDLPLYPTGQETPLTAPHLNEQPQVALCPVQNLPVKATILQTAKVLLKQKFNQCFTLTLFGCGILMFISGWAAAAIYDAHTGKKIFIDGLQVAIEQGAVKFYQDTQLVSCELIKKDNSRHEHIDETHCKVAQ
ncbi:winged helix-turn-helix domain-containing protein [Dryocola clanedunensis]